MKYWGKLQKEEAGFYYAESDFTTDILHIFRISNGLWGWAYNNGMTKGTFSTFKEARSHFGI